VQVSGHPPPVVNAARPVTGRLKQPRRRAAPGGHREEIFLPARPAGLRAPCNRVTMPICGAWRSTLIFSVPSDRGHCEADRKAGWTRLPDRPAGRRPRLIEAGRPDRSGRQAPV